MIRAGGRALVVALAVLTVLASAGLAVAAASGSGGDARSALPTDVVTILANGTISPANAPISRSGETYTLSSPLNGSLLVLASGVTVDGAGRLINYEGGGPDGDGAAVTLLNTSGDLVEQVRSANATIGILANDTTAATIRDDPVTGTSYSLEVIGSSGTTLTGDGVANGSIGGTGLMIQYSSDVLATGNIAAGDAVGFYVLNSTDVTLDGNFANHTGADGIIIEGSTDVVADDNQLDGARSALVAEFAVDVDVSSGIVANDDNGNGTPDGFYAYESDDLAFEDDNASFADQGFYFYGVTNGLASGDSAFETNTAFISNYGSNVSFLDNSAPRTVTAFEFDSDDGLLVQGNDAPLASEYGLSAYLSTNVTIAGNDLAEVGGVGVELKESAAVTVTDNNLSSFDDFGVADDEPYGLVSVAGNDIAHASSTTGTGVYIYEGYGALTVSGNELDRNEYGIEASASSGAITVTANNISKSSEDAFMLVGTSGAVSVTGNDLADPSVAGVAAYGLDAGSLTVTDNDVDDAVNAVYDDEDAFGYVPFEADNNTATGASQGVVAFGVEGPVTVLDNDVSHSRIYGILAEDCEDGPTLISGNNASDAGNQGIFAEENLNVTISDNTAVNVSDAAVAVDEDAGQDVVIGNDLARAHTYGIYDVENRQGGSVIEGNNVGGSADALDLEDCAFPTVVDGNDFADSGSTEAVACLLSSYAANDQLNDSTISFTNDTIGLFYHNDLNSTAFNASGNIVGGGSWNAPYPVGGNYWTGYRGTDERSGPGQDLPGADGIGDTPYTVGPATDRYPLMVPWIAATITFEETGLPSGTTWSVTFDGTTDRAASGAAIVFEQVNGASTPFNYSIATSSRNYTTSAPSGSGTEDGADQVITVPFAVLASSVLYAVVFIESGLPAGYAWSVTLNGTTLTTTGSSITFHLPDGEYAYTVTLPSGYSASPSSGHVDVSGGSVTESITVTSTSSPGTSGTSSGGTLTNPLSAGLLVGLLAAIVLALVGWILYVRGRKPPPMSTAPPPASGVPPPAPPVPPVPPPPPPPAA